MCPHPLTKEQKGYTYGNAYFSFFLKKCQNCDKSTISELPTVDGNWIHKIESQRRVNNQQWLCKDQARHFIEKHSKTRDKKFCLLYF